MSKMRYTKHGVTPLCGHCHGDLHYLSEEDRTRLKGRVSLYCIECGRKHFSNVEALDQWALDVKEGRAPRPVKPAPPEPEELPTDELQTGEDDPVDPPDQPDA